MIRAFLQRLRDKASARQFQDGWDWAAGELLRGKSSEELSEQLSIVDEDAFDMGAVSAINTWEARETIYEQENGVMKLMASCTCGGPEGVTDYG